MNEELEAWDLSDNGAMVDHRAFEPEPSSEELRRFVRFAALWEIQDTVLDHYLEFQARAKR